MWQTELNFFLLAPASRLRSVDVSDQDIASTREITLVRVLPSKPAEVIKSATLDPDLASFAGIARRQGVKDERAVAPAHLQLITTRKT